MKKLIYIFALCSLYSCKKGSDPAPDPLGNLPGVYQTIIPETDSTYETRLTATITKDSDSKVILAVESADNTNLSDVDTYKFEPVEVVDRKKIEINQTVPGIIVATSPVRIIASIQFRISAELIGEKLKLSESTKSTYTPGNILISDKDFSPVSSIMLDRIK